MPRRGHIARRDVLPDPMYNSKTVTRLINNIMLDGKKGVAQRIVYDAFDIIKEKTGKDPVEVFEEAMNQVMPVLEYAVRKKAFRKNHGRKTRKRAYGCYQQHRWCLQEEGRHPQDGRSE